jgi:hypothetical protein
LPLIFASFSYFRFAPPALPEPFRHVDYATLMFRRYACHAIFITLIFFRLPPPLPLIRRAFHATLARLRHAAADAAAALAPFRHISLLSR